MVSRAEMLYIFTEINCNCMNHGEHVAQTLKSKTGGTPKKVGPKYQKFVKKIFTDDIFKDKASYSQQPPIVCSLPFPSRRVLCPQMGCRASNFYCLVENIYSYHQIGNLKEHEWMMPCALYLERSRGNHHKVRISRNHFVFIMTIKQSTIELMGC